MALCGFTYVEMTQNNPPTSIYLFISVAENCRLLKVVSVFVFPQQKHSRCFVRSRNKGLNKDILVTLLVLYL